MWPEKKYIVYKRTAVRLAALKKARMWQYVQKAGRIRGKKKKRQVLIHISPKKICK